MAEVTMVSGVIKRGIMYKEEVNRSFVKSLSLSNRADKDRLIRIDIASKGVKVPFLWCRLNAGETMLYPEGHFMLEKGDSLVSRSMSIGRDGKFVAFHLQLYIFGEGE